MNELQTLRHSASHILAQAVKRLFPDTKLAIGPAIDNGFYYDFDTEHTFTPEDLEAIEKEMKKIVKENLRIERFELPRNEALELMKDEPYKVELVKVALCHKRSFCHLPAALLFFVLNKSLQKLYYSCTLRQKYRQALTD